ncbi:Hcp family type VI secretion system effector [Jiella mangrovi]|uniref:Type VI secretion system tube protein Hcp n=1 Tax=Jiella mangrovi TaxID=2821407 RepID=A0ABS4BIE3_9HYPH|nr:type VI secretion system tube protein Hcp [Jiella mangrovi]MBP0615936.1 type VI secretion system tube protein Hcp [Jiella mangrovi]
MAVDIFLKIEGIPGESQDATHAGEIRILAWSWGLAQSGTTHMGPGAGSGKVAVQDITFTKNCDKATTNILRFCSNGKHIPQALLTIRKAGGDAPVEYFKLMMTDLIISSYATGGSADGLDQLQETVTLNFRKFTVTYTEQTRQGTPGAATEATWDIAANVGH